MPALRNVTTNNDADDEDKSVDSTMTHKKRASQDSSEQRMVEEAARAMTDAAAKRAPSWMVPYLQKARPVLAMIGKFIDLIGPYIELAIDKSIQLWILAQPYKPELFLPVLAGLVMMFFGGIYMTLISCAEAYRLCGWKASRDAIVVLWTNFKNVRTASKADDELDEDGDGIADVKQISDKQLVTRKLTLFLRVTKPHQLNNALSGIYAGWLAVAAVLRLEFARVISLGAAIGDILTKTAIKLFHKPLEQLTPPEYKDWVDVGISYTMRIIGVSIAWYLARIIATFHCALRGAFLFVEAVTVYAEANGYGQYTEGYWDEACAGVLCVTGIYWQLSMNLSLPWILSIPLMPVTTLEYALQWMVAKDVVH